MKDCSVKLNKNVDEISHRRTVFLQLGYVCKCRMSVEFTHVQRVRILYKTILKLHRGMPEALQALGNNYVKDEFRRHKSCNPAEASVFMNEWTNYALHLSEQLGLRGLQTAKPLGSHLSSDQLDTLNDQQIRQLYELLQAANSLTEESTRT